MIPFLEGMLTMGYGAAGLLFLKFWRRAGDRLFLWFALAFWLLASQRGLLTAASDAVSDAREERLVAVYLLRLVAFAVILWAIADKNRKSRRRAAIPANQHPASPRLGQ